MQRMIGMIVDLLLKVAAALLFLGVVLGAQYEFRYAPHFFYFAAAGFLSCCALYVNLFARRSEWRFLDKRWYQLLFDNSVASVSAIIAGSSGMFLLMYLLNAVGVQPWPDVLTLAVFFVVSAGGAVAYPMISRAA